MLKYSYAYDNLNQLVRENNAVANKTYVYTYDDAGNITAKKTYAYTTGTVGTATSTYSYTYGNSSWGDQLTAYRGVSITYDKLGNPLSYYNGSSYTFTWANGRQLESVHRYETITYTYNADGIRTSKNIGGSMVEYLLDGTQIIGEKNGSHIIRYLYDPQGMPVGMVLDSVTYLYEKNLQGDVIGIYTTSGTKIASYTYDAWGNIVSSSYTSGYYNPFYYNPFRYRGYYYDTETGFYYLQSRYYDPATGRFLNADGVMAGTGSCLLGNNLYIYCFNNPLSMQDSNGNWPAWIETAAKITSAVVAVAATVAMVAAVTAFTAGTGSAAAIYAASIPLSGVLSGINGGVANEANGNSYLNGYIGGAFGGVVQSTASQFPLGTILGGGIGVAGGTAITGLLNNLDPDSQDSTSQDIIISSIISGGKALITSSLTSAVGYASDLAVSNGANGLMSTYTFGFGEAIKTFFGWLDDALVYLWE